MRQQRLVLFTRYPTPGQVKTRLIPAVGPEAAAELHRRMTEHTLEMARRTRARLGCDLEVRYDGGDEQQFTSWLGHDVVLRPQGNGDLGHRMGRAVRDALQTDVFGVVLIGADCPGLDVHHLVAAFFGLEGRDVVVGPAEDGGYYLLGARVTVPELFQGIPWGSSVVLPRTLDFAQRAGYSVLRLEMLPDIDRPEDLTHLPAAIRGTL